MAGFKGNFALKMDAAGRVALPAAFRKALPETVTLLKGMSEALYVIPEDRFDAWVDGCGFIRVSRPTWRTRRSTTAFTVSRSMRP